MCVQAMTTCFVTLSEENNLQLVLNKPDFDTDGEKTSLLSLPHTLHPLKAVTPQCYSLQLLTDMLDFGMWDVIPGCREHT